MKKVTLFTVVALFISLGILSGCTDTNTVVYDDDIFYQEWIVPSVDSVVGPVDEALDAYEMNDRCPLGAAAGYGVPVPLDPDLTARLLGFARSEQVCSWFDKNGCLNPKFSIEYCSTAILRRKSASCLLIFRITCFSTCLIPYFFLRALHSRSAVTTSSGLEFNARLSLTPHFVEEN